MIADAFEAAYKKLIDYSIALDILQYLKYEEEYLPWSTAMQKLESMSEMGDFFKGREGSTSYKVEIANKIFSDYVMNLLRHVYKRSFFEDVAIQSNEEDYILKSAAFENIIRHMKFVDMGVKVDGRYLHHLRFADDIVLITLNIEQA
ncbi:unnamed protein product [Haemonchus placei]|uniref:Reverse transcriptase domain-containing protein n=1 Tax=Haemonchus placei TaxID=6290 RepID=A0A0N4W5R6_HAEPC|nr:unnamed protein product [Haemonchus placei]